MSRVHQHKIALLLDGLEATTAGGTERQALVLARWLREAGHDVRFYVFRGQAFTSEFPIRNIGYRSWWRPTSLLRLFGLVRELRREHVCALQSFFVEANLLGPLIARLARVPVVLGSRRNVNHWMSPVFARLQRASNRITTAIVANSEAVKDATVKVERTPAEKIIVQYNGVDVAAFANAASERARIRGEWQLKSDAVVVGTVATLRPVKGIDVFIDAARSVANHSERAYFVIIGDGPYRTQLHEQARLTGLGDRIRFAGETNQIPALLSALDVAVLPSRAEGFSNALLEYMAAGLPVVATAVGGNAEALDHTGCLIVPPADASTLADAVISLIGSADARVRIGTAARKRAREAFDIATAKERAVDLYADLLRDHCSRSQPGA